jgi:hypothetical protein
MRPCSPRAPQAVGDLRDQPSHLGSAGANRGRLSPKPVSQVPNRGGLSVRGLATPTAASGGAAKGLAEGEQGLAASTGRPSFRRRADGPLTARAYHDMTDDAKVTKLPPGRASGARRPRDMAKRLSKAFTGTDGHLHRRARWGTRCKWHQQQGILLAFALWN